jgi:hypothetical protein
MSSHSPSSPRRLSRAALPPIVCDGTGGNFASSVFLGDLGGILLVAAGTLFTALVALLDHHTASRYSFSLFYLIPVAACAWWGGFSCGIFLALAGTVAWYGVDSFRDPTIPHGHDVERHRPVLHLTLVSA